MTKVDRAWFVKGATVIWTKLDCSKIAAGVDVDVCCIVTGTRKFANGTMRVYLQHPHGWGFAIVVPPGDEIKARIRPAA